jgi:hypothetical protein
VSRRRKIVLSVLGVVVLLFGAASLWQSGQTDQRFARILLLDPTTGETLHQQTMDGGYAVVALLRGGRIAVATMTSCVPPPKGGAITVLDATLQRVVSSRSIAPCAVELLDPALLAKRFGDAGAPVTRGMTTGGYAVDYSGGRLLEAADKSDPNGRSSSVVAYDADGRVRWKRSNLGGWLGPADVRNGRIAVPVLGEFTPGSD